MASPQAQISLAADSICQAAFGSEIVYVGYNSFKPKDSAGAEVKACEHNKRTTSGGNEFWKHSFDFTLNEAECQSKNQAVWEAAGSAGDPGEHYNWVTVRTRFETDCSKLRLAGHSLGVCQFNADPSYEPSFNPPDWDTTPQPHNWWDNENRIGPSG